MANRKNITSFLLFILLIVAIEWVGHVLTMSSVTDWYLTLKKPSWNPPGYVFGPIWTILYIMIAISGWRV
ncbi:MAG: tryptophan-rich sensory protein, partial [Chlamydiae bacterium]|nr:tryptophan-rich sensory protein [Chlamydiota bacterium]